MARTLSPVRRSLAAFLLIPLLSQTGWGQEPAASGLALLGRFESTLAGTIARCERSVVAIARSQRPDAQLAGPGLFGRQRAFNAGQQAILQGGLLALQSPVPQTSEPSGAGVVIDAEAGLVLTQYLVVGRGEAHSVTDLEGERYSAKVLAADPRGGLALLQVESRLSDPDNDTPIRLPALPIGKAEELRKGNFVIAIGNPFSIESDGQPTASWGSVTNTARKAPDNSNLNNSRSPIDGSYRTSLHHFGSLIQTDAKLGWNASGGAVVNLAGELVGITTTVGAIAGHESPAGYAIPLNKAMRRAIGDLRQGRVPEYGFLGINGFGPDRSVTSGNRGIRIGAALDGGPAHRAGLRGKELITRIDGKPIRSNSLLQLTIGSIPVGTTVPVAYEIGRESREAAVTLGKAYVDPNAVFETRPRYPEWRGIRVDYATAVPDPRIAAADGKIDPAGCVVVASVNEQSGSWTQGVRRYDFISHVNNRRVSTPAEFYDAVGSGADNVKLKFTKPLSAAAPKPPQPPKPPQR